MTPISSDVPSTFKLSFTNKSLPTNKSPPVVVIPPLELSVDIPVTINESKVAKPSSNIEFEVIVTPVPTSIFSFDPSIIIPVAPKMSGLKVAMPLKFKLFKLL